MTWVLLIFICALIALNTYQLYWRDNSETARVAAIVSANAAQHHEHTRVIDSLNSAALSRESALRDDIRALTEALGRSKESVPVIYPRDMSKPLEPSDGWYDSKPTMKVRV